jgi:hypothetical protein
MTKPQKCLDWRLGAFAVYWWRAVFSSAPDGPNHNDVDNARNLLRELLGRRVRERDKKGEEGISDQSVKRAFGKRKDPTKPRLKGDFLPDAWAPELMEALKHGMIYDGASLAWQYVKSREGRTGAVPGWNAEEAPQLAPLRASLKLLFEGGDSSDWDFLNADEALVRALDQAVPDPGGSGPGKELATPFATMEPSAGKVLVPPGSAWPKEPARLALKMFLFRAMNPTWQRLADGKKLRDRIVDAEKECDDFDDAALGIAAGATGLTVAESTAATLLAAIEPLWPVDFGMLADGVRECGGGEIGPRLVAHFGASPSSAQQAHPLFAVSERTIALASPKTASVLREASGLRLSSARVVQWLGRVLAERRAGYSRVREFARSALCVGFCDPKSTPELELALRILSAAARAGDRDAAAVLLALLAYQLPPPATTELADKRYGRGRRLVDKGAAAGVVSCMVVKALIGWDPKAPGAPESDSVKLLRSAVLREATAAREDTSLVPDRAASCALGLLEVLGELGPDERKRGRRRLALAADAGDPTAAIELSVGARRSGSLSVEQWKDRLSAAAADEPQRGSPLAAWEWGMRLALGEDLPEKGAVWGEKYQARAARGGSADALFDYFRWALDGRWHGLNETSWPTLRAWAEDLDLEHRPIPWLSGQLDVLEMLAMSGEGSALAVGIEAAAYAVGRGEAEGIPYLVALAARAPASEKLLMDDVDLLLEGLASTGEPHALLGLGLGCLLRWDGGGDPSAAQKREQLLNEVRSFFAEVPQEDALARSCELLCALVEAAHEQPERAVAALEAAASTLEKRTDVAGTGLASRVRALLDRMRTPSD